LVKGGTVADIGTDHALLPVALVQSGRCRKGYACDIGVGPLESAGRTIAAAGLEERIERVLCNGIPAQCADCDTVIIAGMGGLLIADILSRAAIAAHTQLLLQPMTKAPELRRWLIANGFTIEREQYVREGKMLYVILDARRGQSRPYSTAELEVGCFTDSPAAREYVTRRRDLLALRRDNEKQAGRDVSQLQLLIEELEKRL
jgi:tRNA (adenine22-N1)-methyltransferase